MKCGVKAKNGTNNREAVEYHPAPKSFKFRQVLHLTEQGFSSN